MTTPQSKIRAAKHCGSIMDNRRSSPRRENTNQNAANEMNGSPSDRGGLTYGMNRYNTLKVNNNVIINIPHDMICLKPKIWTGDYIAACQPYLPAFK